jgi:hypothetical protein
MYTNTIDNLVSVAQFSNGGLLFGGELFGNAINVHPSLSFPCLILAQFVSFVIQPASYIVIGIGSLVYNSVVWLFH